MKKIKSMARASHEFLRIQDRLHSKVNNIYETKNYKKKNYDNVVEPLEAC